MKGRRQLASAAGFTVAVLLLTSGCSEKSEQSPANTASSNTPLLIVPHVSVGEIRSGMSTTQIVAILGEPQRRTANALEYTRFGFAALPGKDGRVQFVMCGDVTGINGPLVKVFTGRTKEGIGMNSSREEVLKAYGEPSEARKLPEGLESLRYDPLGMTFTLQAGKVHHIIVALPPSSEPDRTVNLEPAPK